MGVSFGLTLPSKLVAVVSHPKSQGANVPLMSMSSEDKLHKYDEKEEQMQPPQIDRDGVYKTILNIVFKVNQVFDFSLLNH